MLLNSTNLRKYVLFLADYWAVLVCLLISLHAYVYLVHLCVFMYEEQELATVMCEVVRKVTQEISYIITLVCIFEAHWLQ